MSAASRLRAADGRFVTAASAPGVPGALGVRLDHPIEAAGIEWTPQDAHLAPIGAALAVETAGGSVPDTRETP